MATRSSITGDDRNPGWTEAEIEGYFATYLGVKQVIWLDGQFGGNEDITDQHIDGFVKFASGNTIVTMSNPDLAYWYVDAQDRNMIAQVCKGCTPRVLPWASIVKTCCSGGHGPLRDPAATCWHHPPLRGRAHA